MQRRPTHAAVSHFLSSILPSKPNDVQFLYHIPRHPRYYDPTRCIADQIVLSVTATSGVYDLIGYSTLEDGIEAQDLAQRHVNSIAFLHRPWQLDRRRVMRGNLVLASHTTFDELLTTGWNVALAQRLGIDVQDVLCVQGYKGDPERKIGLVGRSSLSAQGLRQRIEEECGSIEHVEMGACEEIRVVAIMNAFHEDEVGRVLAMCVERAWVPMAGEHAGRHVLYLTGQPRESGLEGAKAHGMSVVCVGHRAAEEWGIRYLAGRLRAEFPSLRVKEVLEPEENVERV